MPEDVDYSHFGMIGHMKDCFFGLFGVLWEKPLPVFQQGISAAGNFKNHAKLSPMPKLSVGPSIIRR